MTTSAEEWANDILNKGYESARHVLSAIEGEVQSHKRRGGMPPNLTRQRQSALAALLASNQPNKTEQEPEPANDNDITAHEHVDFTAKVCNKYLHLKKGAAQRGKEFSLTFGDVKRLMSIKRCQYTGAKLTTPVGVEASGNDRTIDRLDPEKGYVPGNVFAVTFDANAAKNLILEHHNSKLEIDYALKLLNNLKAKGFK